MSPIDVRGDRQAADSLWHWDTSEERAYVL